MPYRASPTAQDLPVKSTGINVLGGGEWRCKRSGAGLVAGNGVGDARTLHGSFRQPSQGEAVVSFSGEGAHDTIENHAAMAWLRLTLE